MVKQDLIKKHLDSNDPNDVLRFFENSWDDLGLLETDCNDDDIEYVVHYNPLFDEKWGAHCIALKNGLKIYANCTWSSTYSGAYDMFLVSGKRFIYLRSESYFNLFHNYIFSETHFENESIRSLNVDEEHNDTRKIAKDDMVFLKILYSDHRTIEQLCSEMADPIIIINGFQQIRLSDCIQFLSADDLPKYVNYKQFVGPRVFNEHLKKVYLDKCSSPSSYHGTAHYDIFNK